MPVHLPRRILQVERNSGHNYGGGETGFFRQSIPTQQTAYRFQENDENADVVSAAYHISGDLNPSSSAATWRFLNP